MIRTRLSLAAVLALLALAAAACGGGGSNDSTSSNGVPSDAVATVAGTTITRAQLDDLLDVTAVTSKQQKQAFPKPGTAEYQALQQQAAVFLVAKKEYEQEAARRGLSVKDADVDKALDDLVKQKFSGKREKFDDYLKTTGYTLDQFKTGLRRQLIEQRIYNDVTKGLTVSAATVKAYYDKNKSAPPYTTPAQRRVRHILVAVNANGTGVAAKGVTDTKVDFAKSKALADKLRRQLASGASFTALVKKYTQDPGSKDTGGEYTDVKGTFQKAFEQATFSLKTKQISQPVKTQYGYHLIQPLAATKQGATQSFARVAASIRATLVQPKQQAAIQKFGVELKNRYKGKVKYAAGFAPPAATTTGTTTAP